MLFFFFSSRRRHTILQGDWSSDVCSSDLSGVPSGSGRGAHDRFVDAPNATRAGIERPDIVATARILVAPSDKAGATNFLRRKQRIEREQPHAIGRFEVSIGRDRLDFGASDQVVTRIMSGLGVFDLFGLRSSLLASGV